MSELNLKHLETTHNSSDDLNASSASFMSNIDKIAVYQIPGTQFVTILMTNDKGELVKRNVKLHEGDLSRDNTMIDAIARDNSLFK